MKLRDFLIFACWPLLLGLRACAGDPPAAKAEEADLAAKYGIQVASLRMSAQDHLVDFRYKVIDPAKASALGKRDAKPVMVDKATGTKLHVPKSPKVGALRQRNDESSAGRIFVVLFGNPAKVVRSGSKVSVEIGDFRVDNLTVE